MSGGWIDDHTYEEDTDPVNDYATGPVVAEGVGRVATLFNEEILSVLKPFAEEMKNLPAPSKRQAALISLYLKLGGKL